MALIKTNARSATALDATILTGNLPAINGSALTNIDGGKIGQVIQGTTGTYTETTLTDWLDFGLTATITPTATSSKVLLWYELVGFQHNNSGTVIQVANWVDIGGAGYNVVRYWDQAIASPFDSTITSSTTPLAGTSYCELITTNSTASHAYKLQWRQSGAGTMFKHNYYTTASQVISTLTLMEVLA